MEKLKALLFGIDGLISNINQINFIVWQKTLQDYGYELSFQDFLQLFLFEHPPNLLIVLLPYCTVDEHSQIVARKEDLFIRTTSAMDKSQFHLTTGLREFIDDTKKHDVNIVAVSDLSIKETTHLLSVIGLTDVVS
jgi:beta-phosphoglucomutase-like phosphatase (HAD superfamily)